MKSTTLDNFRLKKSLLNILEAQNFALDLISYRGSSVEAHALVCEFVQ